MQNFKFWKNLNVCLFTENTVLRGFPSFEALPLNQFQNDAPVPCALEIIGLLDIRTTKKSSF